MLDAMLNVEGSVLRGLTSESLAAAVEYMSQWDYGEENDAAGLHPDPNPGNYDELVECGEYVVVYNAHLGHVGLWRQAIEAD